MLSALVQLIVITVIVFGVAQSQKKAELECDDADAVLAAHMREYITSIHNFNRRGAIHMEYKDAMHTNLPKGGWMYKLKYSCTLEKRAQSVANKCKMGVTKPEEKLNAGENQFFQFTKTKNTDPKLLYEALAKAYSHWWGELGQYKPNQNNTYNLHIKKSETGDFTQIIWGLTTRLGCGAKLCAGKGILVICFYEPTGNEPGKKIYNDAIGPCKKPDDCKYYKKSICELGTGLCER